MNENTGENYQPNQNPNQQYTNNNQTQHQYQQQQMQPQPQPQPVVNENLNYFSYIFETIKNPVHNIFVNFEALKSPKNGLILAFIIAISITALTFFHIIFETLFISSSGFFSSLDMDVGMGGMIDTGRAGSQELSFEMENLEKLKDISVLNLLIKPVVNYFLGLLILSGVFYITSLLFNKKSSYIQILSVISTALIPVVIANVFLCTIIGYFSDPLHAFISILGPVYGVLISIFGFTTIIPFEKPDYFIYFYTASLAALGLASYYVF